MSERRCSRMKNKKTLTTLALMLGVYALGHILILTGVINDYSFAVLATTGINIILATSLNLVTGFTGQFSLGHAGFMSIGAYVCAIITQRVEGTVGFVLGVLAGASAAALVGVLVGLPTLRLRGDYLAIATLGMAEIIRVLFLNMEITNGAAGLSFLPRFVDWNWLFLLTAGTLVLLSNFLHSSPGRACISVREDEIAAESMGINTTKYKVTAFSMGAFFAGVAGAMYASYFYFLKPDLFNFNKSIDILVIVVLGGMGSLSGSVIAAVLLQLISTWLSAFPELRMVIYSLMLVAIMLFRPQGLLGSTEVTELLSAKLPQLFGGKGGQKKEEGV
ncbi:MAG: branched-chain amino acid ABC transporter permease [Clostridia bacterium]|nr:branched-chain amino acid ABC transporter permease [Clostridia bacterium]